MRTNLSPKSKASGLARFPRLLLIGIAILLSTIPLSAQLAGKGSIKGSVTDPTGAVVPNATITATSTTRGTKLTVTSTAAGDYNLSPLDPDIYTVTVKAAGFSTTTQQNVHVNALEVSDVNIALNVGSENETVTVSSAPPEIETSNATLGGTMENELYSALPIEMGAYGQPDQRRATDFAFLMPGVQANNTNGNATTNTGIVNGSGSRGAVSAVYIDGLPFVRAGGNGDPRFVWTAISVDAVDQFQVQTTGYSAIYEGQGIQNYNIKQGGNKYHGAAYEFFRNTALDTWGFFGPLNVNPITGKPSKPVEHSNEYGIHLSGPLVPIGSLKEKLFFFGNYNGFRYTSQTPTPMTFPTAAEQAGNFQGLVTWRHLRSVQSDTVHGLLWPAMPLSLWLHPRSERLFSAGFAVSYESHELPGHYPGEPIFRRRSQTPELPAWEALERRRPITTSRPISPA